MPTIIDVLKRNPEKQPEWLCAPEPPRFDRNTFFQSRTVYYPGCGIDAQPVKLCARSHAAHAFVYVDQSIDWDDDMHDRLAWRGPDPGFLGYDLKHHEEVIMEDLRPGGWAPHVKQYEVQDANRWADSFVRPYAHFAVLDRQPEFGEEHGPKRIVILFIGGDGFASYDALYCQNDGTRPPFLALIQDHGGFSVNYNRFGRNGLLERISRRTMVFPSFLLVGSPYTFEFEPWSGYADTGADPHKGGMHKQCRRLYRREPQPGADPERHVALHALWRHHARHGLFYQPRFRSS